MPIDLVAERLQDTFRIAGDSVAPIGTRTKYIIDERLHPVCGGAGSGLREQLGWVENRAGKSASRHDCGRPPKDVSASDIRHRPLPCDPFFSFLRIVELAVHHHGSFWKWFPAVELAVFDA